VLTRAAIICLALLPCLPAAGNAGGWKESIREPVRLTAGASNQMMGVLSPDGRALYFVSDKNSTNEIFVQDPVDSGPRLLFDSNADLAWPRLDPRGGVLAYISYGADAAGDLCLLDLESGERRCLTGMETSEMQVMWMGPGKPAALVRPGLHEDYELRVFDPGGSGSGRVLLRRNLLGASVSPDGKFLAYVPLLRTAEQVGVSFSNRTGEGLALQRLSASNAPIKFRPDLPGVTGFPAFARDGRHLYFSQYLNDTNSDGTIDGNDHSVLFRVRFDPTRPDPLGGSFPEQLTSAGWNCRYPAPSAGRLITTCSHDGSLDVYSLPLGGAVPSGWKTDRLRAELHSARNHWTRLLLLGRLLSLETGRGAKIEVLRRMVLAHMDLGEYESATYYCQQIERLAGDPGGAASGWARVMRELVGHRREDIALTHGQLSDRYIKSEAERAGRLVTLVDRVPADVRSLAFSAISEIQDDIGKKAEAAETFARVDPEKIEDPRVLPVVAQRAAELLSLRGDREALLSLYLSLSGHPALPALEHMRYAVLFIDELTRGVPMAWRPARVAAWLEKVKPESELSILLRVEALLLRLSDDTKEEVRKGIFAIYKKHKDVDRRRAIVLETVKTAARLGVEYLQYQFATSWASLLKRDNPERKHAEDLYESIVMERAYTELAKGKVKGARAQFYATTLRTESLEAHAGFIEAWIREGRKDLDATYQKRFGKRPDHPALAFVQAYRTARTISDIRGPGEFSKACKRALGLLKRASAELPRSLEIHQLRGYLLHQRFIRTGDKQDANSANNHYLLALDLARDNPRYRATILQQVGLLQASLGNHRIAIDHLTRRDRLPHVRRDGELNLCMALARSYFHIGEDQKAVGQAERALKLVDGSKELAAYRPLVIDRLALYRQSAGNPAGALELYRRLEPMVAAGSPEGLGARINRLKARLGAAAAALDAGNQDLALSKLKEIQSILDSAEPLRPAIENREKSIFDEHRFGRNDYEILAAGLEARAHRELKDYPAAMRAMQRRYDLLAARFGDTDTDADLLDMARACHHLGEIAYRSQQPDLAREYLEKGLGHSEVYNQRTGSGVNEVELRLLQAYAELHLYGKLELANYTLDLMKRIETVYDFICEHPSPAWEADRFILELYLTMLTLEALNFS